MCADMYIQVECMCFPEESPLKNCSELEPLLSLGKGLILENRLLRSRHKPSSCNEHNSIS